MKGIDDYFTSEAPTSTPASPSDGEERKPKVKRLHQEFSGKGRMEYDGYDDVRQACERKLGQWEREGIIPVYSGFRSKDWLFQKGE